ARRLAEENPKTNQNLTSANVQPLANSMVGPQFRQTVWAMLAAVILVLLIACVNVMNMQFGRAALRAKELAIRGAVGATSSRLVNLITRSLVVGQIALTAALLIAATLQIKSIRNQITLNYGYDEHAIYSARMGLMEGAYPTDDAKRGFFMRVLRELRANPQFDGAALTDRFRMTFASQGQYEVDGQTYMTDRDRPRGNFESVSDNYFSTIGL